MKPWILVDRAKPPADGSELRLYRRDSEFSIKVGVQELMNSRVHGSEDALAELACKRLKDRPGLHILVGGLGLGFTLRGVLNCLGPDGRVVVAELVPEVVEWNRVYLGGLAGNPMRDDRVELRKCDVGRVIREKGGAYDAIILDVDNGPRALTSRRNDRIYGLSGLNAAFCALHPGGVLAVWSAGPDDEFTQRLNKVGFMVEVVRVRARGAHGGAWHTIWLAVRPDRVSKII